MTFHPWRISAWYFKLLYIVVGYAAGLGVIHLFGLLHPWRPLSLWLSVCVDATLLWVGTRVFRGTNENYLAPRAWWRMTSKPTLSRRLGILWTVLASFSLLGTIVEPFLVAVRFDQELTLGVVALEYAALAYLYLNSAVRQKRQLELQGVEPATA